MHDYMHVAAFPCFSSLVILLFPAFRQHAYMRDLTLQAAASWMELDQSVVGTKVLGFGPNGPNFAHFG